MAICKLCMSLSGNAMRPIYLVSGNAVRDGEAPPVGSKRPSKVTIAAQNKEDGETIFISINGWRDRAADVMAVRKGDSVLCIGPLTTNEYNGKSYVNVDADFIIRSGVDGSMPATDFAIFSAPQMDFADLSEDDGDEELPF